MVVVVISDDSVCYGSGSAGICGLAVLIVELTVLIISQAAPIVYWNQERPSLPKPMMHIAHSHQFPQNLFPPISVKFTNLFPPYFPPHLRVLLNLRFVCFPLFWPCCIDTSCFTRTGRLWLKSTQGLTIRHRCNLKADHDSISTVLWTLQHNDLTRRLRILILHKSVVTMRLIRDSESILALTWPSHTLFLASVCSLSFLFTVGWRP